MVEAVSIVVRTAVIIRHDAPNTDHSPKPAFMHPDVQSLLAVQREDLEIYALETRLSALAPRLAALENERARAAQELERATRSVEVEESRLREAQLKTDTH